MASSYSPRGQLIGHHDLLIFAGCEQPKRILHRTLVETVTLTHLHWSSLAAARATVDFLAILGRVHAAEVTATVVAS